MTTKKIPLKDANAPQMRAFAKNHLGIGFEFGATLEKMRSTISAAWEGDEIIVPDTPAPAAAQPKKAKAPAIITARDAPVPPPAWTPPVAGQQSGGGPMFADPTKAPKVRCIIHAGHGDLGHRPVEVSVNGKDKRYPRGEPVEMHLPFYEVLVAAKEKRYYQKTVADEQGHQAIITECREEPVYAIQLLNPVAA